MDIQKFVRDAYLPVLEEKDDALCSKFGGGALLLSTEHWPKCSSCQKHMPLFVQLVGDTLPGPEVYQGKVVQLFYCTECDEGWDAENSLSKLVRVLPQEDLVSMASPLEGAEKTIMGWSRAKDFPSPEEELEELISWQSSNAENYEQWADSQENIALSGDKLLGWPYWVQGEEYPKCPDCQEKMTLLFQIDSEDNIDFMFGDSGCGHITYCPRHPQNVKFGWACC